MRDELGLANIVNGYGMTECGAIAMTRQGDDAETVANTCGYPLPGIAVRCVDDQGNELPVGTPGELLVRGHAVMKGYLDDPEATADAIDPQGWLHTGDVGKAFIVPRSNVAISEAEIIEWSRQHIANYKVPRVVVLTDDLPRNAAGKIMKTELR